MKLFKRPQIKTTVESNLEVQPEVQSESLQHPIPRKGMYRKWEMVNGKLISRWFHHPD